MTHIERMEELERQNALREVESKKYIDRMNVFKGAFLSKEGREPSRAELLEESRRLSRIYRYPTAEMQKLIESLPEKK